ncbi:MAG: ROK family protein [Calditrichaeota bacterium]|nr:MAG: ROK family protein [Calditrichota bacterium]
MSQDQIFAGIDIGGTSIKFGLFNNKGEILYKSQKPTMADKGPLPLIHLISNIGEQLLYYAAEEDHDVKYVGVGSPGAVNSKTGQVVGPCPNIQGWTGMEIGKTLQERLNVPIYVDNDVNSMTLAECKFGAGRNSKSVVCVTVGTGIGGGVMIGSKVLHGHNYSAGELGHMTINFDGPECACGNHGCIEAFCSSRQIINSVKIKLSNNMTDIFKDVLDGDLNNLTVKKIFAAYHKGESIAVEVFKETARYLGIGLAGIVNLLNPETVVIGGGITDGGGTFIQDVEDEIKKRAFSSATEKLTVAKAELGNDAGFIGAGLLGIEK